MIAASQNLVCHIFVPGLPQQQGSKTAFALPVQFGQTRSKVVLKDANEKDLKPWREKVAGYATEHMAQEEEERIESGPVGITAIFSFPRLKAHYKSDGVTLRDNKPFYKTSAPDLDKLQRGIGDALNGIVFKDDAQVAAWDVRKQYGSTPGVQLYVYAL